MSDAPEKPMVARIRRFDKSEDKLVPVPPGQSLDFDPGDITRRWLWPHLGREWHLVRFEPAPEEQDA